MTFKKRNIVKLLLVILIASGGFYLSIGRSSSGRQSARFDLSARWQHHQCPLHEEALTPQKVGVSYRLMPPPTARPYDSVPYHSGPFPNADYDYHHQFLPGSTAKDSALVYVCPVCVKEKHAQEADLNQAVRALQYSPEARADLLQTCLNLRRFQRYYRYPRYRRRMPLVVVANEWVDPKMTLYKYRMKARILSYDEIQERDFSAYLEVTEFAVQRPSPLEAEVRVSFRYPIENVSVQAIFTREAKRWKVERYELIQD